MLLPATDVSYSWNSGQTSGSIVVAPDTTTTYMVSVTYTADTIVCTSTSSIEIAVFDPIEVSLPDDVTFCGQGEVTLEATGGTTYLWNTGDTTNLLSFLAEATQTYSVTATDANNCSATDSTTITVHPLPNPNITGNLDICAGDTATLTATGGQTYLWNTFSQDSSISLTPLSTSEYMVTVVDNNGCVGFDSALVVVSPLPIMPAAPPDLVILPGEPPFEITVDEVPDALSYTWTVPLGVQIISGGDTNTILLDWAGAASGTVCVSAINDCGPGPEACVDVTVDLTDGLNSLTEKDYVIFPNPTTGVVHLLFPPNTSGQLELKDSTGKLIQQTHFTKATTIDLSTLPANGYILLIKTKDNTWAERLIKQ